jgi:hypothetical protein
MLHVRCSSFQAIRDKCRIAHWPPILVVQVPLHGLADAGLEGFGRFPAEFTLYLARIDGVAPVVAGAVGHIGDLVFVGLPSARGFNSSSRAQTVCTMSRLGFSFQPPTL